MSSPAPVWFVTGCSSGLGRALAETLVARGWRVVAAARDIATVQDIVDIAPDRVLAVQLDLNRAEQIEAATAAAVDRFGRVDMLVNNAGYGYQSTVEEGEDQEIRQQFETNMFGLFAMTRAVLPIMRGQRSGTIINITSAGGFMGAPGMSYYCATKFAVEGWSESLRTEVAPLGIRVVSVAPGPFRTDWAGRSFRRTPIAIADYADHLGPLFGMAKRHDGSQRGDPQRAAEVIITLAQMAEAPPHVALGAWANDAIARTLEQRIAAFASQRALGLEADFPDGQP